MGQRRAPVLGRRRIEHGRDPGPGTAILRGEQPEERAGPGKHDRALGDEARGFEQDLRGPRRHHAGQRPAGNGKGPLESARRQDHPPGADQPRRTGDRDADLALTRDAPHRGSRDVVGTAGAERRHEIGAVPVIGAEHRALAQRRLGDAAIDLAAGGRLLVEEHRSDAEARRARCRREAGGTGTDDREIIALAKLARGAHRPASRLPCWVSTRMPSRTRTRQAWRLPTPSMVTRQSKQTPIMQ